MKKSELKKMIREELIKEAGPPLHSEKMLALIDMIVAITKSLGRTRDFSKSVGEFSNADFRKIDSNLKTASSAVDNVRAIVQSSQRQPWPVSNATR